MASAKAMTSSRIDTDVCEYTTYWSNPEPCRRRPIVEVRPGLSSQLWADDALLQSLRLNLRRQALSGAASQFPQCRSLRPMWLARPQYTNASSAALVASCAICPLACARTGSRFAPRDGRPRPRARDHQQQSNSNSARNSVCSVMELGPPLSIHDVARMIGCSPSTVRQTLVPRGLPVFRAGASGKLILYRDQVVRWIEKVQGGI